ncbi:MAG TPA: 4-(cytidine 5'-diphospho)-2-C-methyl-D-erythritol kinase [Coriobacteriia bacterium]
MNGMTEIVPCTVLAHAKVNLFLAVGARRPDGFHDVVTVLQAVELADEVEVRPAGEGTTLERDVDLGIPASEDLAYRAAEAWRTATGYEGGIRVTVRKRIPAGGGLGGGSSDAAAVLWALSGRTSADEPLESGLLELAVGLGADVPFFLGPGTRVMTGRGDRPGETVPTPRLHLALVNPGVPVPTGAAYAQFDRALMPPPPPPDALLGALSEGVARGIAVRLYNNMTQASCALVPEIRGALRFLEDSAGVYGAAMAGSGSTVFGIYDTATRARDAATAARERGWWACETGTSPAGIETPALD